LNDTWYAVWEEQAQCEVDYMIICDMTCLADENRMAVRMSNFFKKFNVSWVVVG